MSLATALDTLCAVAVDGVTTSFGIDDLKGGVTAADLPALLPLLDSGQNGRATYGAEAESFDEKHTIRHRLLLAPATLSAGEAQAALAGLIDAYQAAIQTLAAHAGALDLIVESYEAGIVAWGGQDYWGADFTVTLWVSD
jgi:hypothetical protein